MLSFFLIFFVGLLSKSWSLNSNCMRDILPCATVKAGSIINGENACRYTQTYVSCIDNLLWSTTSCDELSSLVLKSTTYSDAASTMLRNNCDFEIREVFVLNDCEKQKANCSKLTEYPFTEGDIYKKCKYLETFQSCFDKTTAACANRSDIVRIVNMELTRLQYNSTCVGLTYPTTMPTTPTTPTTVTSRTNAAATPSPVKPGVVTINGSSKSAASATSTIVVTLVLSVWAIM